MRLAFESVDSVKQTAFPNVSGHYPISRELEQNKCGGKRYSPLFNASLLELGHLISSSLALNVGFTLSAPLVLRPFGLGLRIQHQFPGSPSCREQILGLLNLHNCFIRNLSPFPYESYIPSPTPIYVHQYPLDSISLETPNTLQVHKNLPIVSNVLKPTCQFSCGASLKKKLDYTTNKLISVKWGLGNYIFFFKGHISL